MARGLDAKEKDILINSFRFWAFENQLKKKKILKSFLSKYLAPKPLKLSSNFASSAISKIVEKIPEVKGKEDQITEIHNSLLNEIIKRGFTKFSVSAKINEYLEVENKDIKKFGDAILDSFDIEKENAEKIKSAINFTIYTDSEEWVLFDILYSFQVGGECKYLLLLSKTNKERNTTNWMSANIISRFEIADEILVETKNESSFFGMNKRKYQVIVQRQRKLDESQISIIIKFFELESIQRFSELTAINQKQIDEKENLISSEI